MAQGPGLHQVQRLTLQQILAPQLQQSLHLLQVPTLELRSLVQEELQQNPLLEEVAKDEPPVEGPTDADDGEADSQETKEDRDFQEEFAALAKQDEEWREYFSQAQSIRKFTPEQEEQRQHFFDSIVQPESLQQHLLSQINLTDMTEEERKIAEFVIGNIDEHGYLSQNCQKCSGERHLKENGRQIVCPHCTGEGRLPLSLDELSISSGVPLENLQEALELVQTFHPVGVGARDLKECLLIQLSRIGKADSLEAAVVRDHLDDLGRKRYPEIARVLSIPVEQVQSIANFISTLEPKPGRMFNTEQQQYVAADVVVQRVGDDYVVMLNDEQIPHLRISNTYKELMGQPDKSREARDYIREKIRAGKFLIKSIYQRQQTIHNIARVIVERQRGFLEQGISYLKPLTMADVANEVGVHETTVSRAVANKYIQTPQGLFEMKYFFTPGFTTESGTTLSNTSVKDQIAQLISRENATQPLSDQEIVAILREQGIPIARRTVAKYRNELGILPSNLRKKY